MLLMPYITKIPYAIAWFIKQKSGNPDSVVLYCADPLDYVVLEPVLKHLPPVTVLAKNRKTAEYLRRLNIPFKRLPLFPKTVIMARHAAHRFPLKRIRKIGFRHGAYHFKAFAGTAYYNAFDVFFMTSDTEVREAQAAGINTARALGFPKLDPAFDGTWSGAALDNFRKRTGSDPAKKTILFTATWDGAGMSAVHLWIDAIAGLTGQYNIWVTVHPWMSRRIVKRLENTPGIRFIRDPDLLPWLLLSDVVIGDNSSLLGEACALDRPLVTFRLPDAARTNPDIVRMLDNISIRISGPDELPDAIDRCLKNPSEKAVQRKEANARMFINLDGTAGKKAAEIIRESGIFDPMHI
ncbi:CDP-glycerol glycerophosphotransferase family protein [bacterium]|nr:CDP-glycerol glycerophosphotransferase family protein [bacterium]